MEKPSYLDGLAATLIAAGVEGRPVNLSADHASNLGKALKGFLEDRATVSDYEEQAKAYRSRIKEIDVMLNGVNAAKQPTFTDIFPQLRGRLLRFPMLGGEPAIPWALAERIYLLYVKVNGSQQSLQRIASRGGFAWSEIDFMMKQADEAWLKSWKEDNTRLGF